jgi:hypothetical protein
MHDALATASFPACIGSSTARSAVCGSVKPPRLPRERLDEELAKWPAGLSEDRQLAMTVSNYNVTLGVGCDHCHTDDWKSVGKKPMKMVAKMTAPL